MVCFFLNKKRGGNRLPSTFVKTTLAVLKRIVVIDDCLSRYLFDKQSNLIIHHTQLYELQFNIQFKITELCINSKQNAYKILCMYYN